jgi:hypothetical protein
MKINFSRHAKRRMKLYHISEEHIMTVLAEGYRENYSPGRFIYTRDMPGFKYPLKIIVEEEGELLTIITAYPLKRGR